MWFSRKIVIVVVACALALVGCSRSKPAEPPGEGLRVIDIQVGRSVGPDKTITDATDTFSPADTFYVAVLTEGAAAGFTLKARSLYEDGQVVDEYLQNLTTVGPASTLFQLEKPDGWPAGGYFVEISLDGAPAGVRRFRVR
jgi:hypothetical protein